MAKCWKSKGRFNLVHGFRTGMGREEVTTEGPFSCDLSVPLISTNRKQRARISGLVHFQSWIPAYGRLLLILCCRPPTSVRVL